jgi:uncharacterized protein
MASSRDSVHTMNVAVLGASPKPDRYANKAVRLLLEYGHEVIPVNPAYQEIEGVPVRASLSDLETASVHTLTLYMKPDRLRPLVSAMIAIKPRRVIMNPGTEDTEIRAALVSSGIEVEEACTLVLLRTGQFTP